MLVQILLKVLQDFNSIKVRLERLFPSIRPLSITNFNSIKVRLELFTLYNQHGKPFYFNSIKVRLELSSQLAFSTPTI